MSQLEVRTIAHKDALVVMYGAAFVRRDRAHCGVQLRDGLPNVEEEPIR